MSPLTLVILSTHSTSVLYVKVIFSPGSHIPRNLNWANQDLLTQAAQAP